MQKVVIMRKHLPFIFVLMLGFVLSIPARAQQRKKVGVVLSGGGAKGVAHIKALQVIEEAGIPIDYIVGTSMGSIIGGLYSIGYTPHQLDSLVRKQDWMFLLSDKVKRSSMSLRERQRAEQYVLSLPFNKKPKDAVAGGIIKGQNLANLFSYLTVGYHDSIDFNRLPIPFACVSEDIVTGNQVVFHKGILAMAMRASMAIPGVFTPVRTDSMILIDGGMVNNFPTDVAKDMGADIIIGVDVQNLPKTMDELNSAPEILSQIVNLSIKKNHAQSVALTDLHINVNVEGYSSASFNPEAIDSLLKRGEEAARDKWDSLVALKKEIGIDERFVMAKRKPYAPLTDTRSIFVKEITFSDAEENDKKWLMKKCKLEEGKEISIKQIEQALFTLRGSQSYSNASYTLSYTPDGYRLHFLLEKKYEKKINVGIRFDSEEIASLLLNTTAQLKTRVPSKVSLTGRLGKRYMARVDYVVEPLQQRNINLSYTFRYNDINIYDRGKRVYNTTYKYHAGEIGFSDVWYKNLRFGFGGRIEYFKYKDFLLKDPKFDMDVKSEYFISYYAQLQHNSLDKGYFPTKGSAFDAAYSLYTDNFARYNGHAPFSALNASWQGVFSLSSRFTLIPGIYGRVLIGQEIPYAYENALGGDVFGRYLPQQLPFAGIYNTELTHRSVTVASLKLRQRLGSKNYITLTGNFALSDDNFFKLLKGKQIFGCSIGYGLDSMFGPLEASLGYSNQSKEVGFYVNLGFSF